VTSVDGFERKGVIFTTFIVDGLMNQQSWTKKDSQWDTLGTAPNF